MNHTRTKKTWHEKNKVDALKMLKEIQRRIQNDSLIVTTCGFWSSGNGGTSTLRIDMMDSESAQLSDHS